MLWTVIGSVAHAQSVGIALGSSSASLGGSVTLEVTLANSDGAQPSALQWDFGYSTDAIASGSVVTGAVVTAAEKSIVFNDLRGGALRSAACCASGRADPGQPGRGGRRPLVEQAASSLVAAWVAEDEATVPWALTPIEVRDELFRQPCDARTLW